MKDEKVLSEGYDVCAKSLVEFGYAGITSKMVQEIHKAWLKGNALPHGVIGIMAEAQFKDYPQIFGKPDEN